MKIPTAAVRLAESAFGNIRSRWAEWFPAASGKLPGEQGDRLDTEAAMKRLYATMWVDTERREVVRLMRQMDQQDGRVKQIHSKLARDAIRGGLVMQVNERASSETIKREWCAFAGRLQLDIEQKLKSDARGLVMEGNLPLQLVYDSSMAVVAGVRMPSDTITPLTDMGGRFKDPGKAFEQRDVMTGRKIGAWAAWQMVLSRLDPDNFDDLGSMGRPFLDACACTWRKLVMTEEDLVIRRRMRAPLRLAHILEGADDTMLLNYRKDVEAKQGEGVTTDFYMTKKGAVTAVQGDAKLSEIEDVVHLLDTFYAGSPAPKAIFGYTDGLSRDVLEDLKRDYYDEVDGLQDVQAMAYAVAFRMHLLFKGIDPGPDEFTLRFAKRRTDTPNQVADLALKYMALGMPWDMIWSYMGEDPEYVLQKLAEQASRTDLYSYYACLAHRKGAPRCLFRAVRADLFDDWLLTKVLDHVMTEDVVAQAVEEIAGAGEAATRERAARRAAVVAELRDQERRRDRLFELLEQGGKDTPDLAGVSKRLRDRSNEIEQLQAELRGLEDGRRRGGPVKIDPAIAVEVMREVVQKADQRQKRTFLANFIDKVTVAPDGIDVDYRPEALLDAGSSANVRSGRLWLLDLGSNQGPTD